MIHCDLVVHKTEGEGRGGRERRGGKEGLEGRKKGWREGGREEGKEGKQGGRRKDFEGRNCSISKSKSFPHINSHWYKVYKM